MGSVLILGGYGNFGKRIAAALLRSGVPVILAGRNEAKGKDLAEKLRTGYPAANVDYAVLDADNNLADGLHRLKPAVVVNTCGPFQQKQYNVAQACIAHKIHYIDLADGRDFVTGIAGLDNAAKAAGVWVISGASTVPGLSSAVIEQYRGEFSRIDSLRYGISPGQKAERGLATTEGILSYIGRKLAPVGGDRKPRYGWQDIYRQDYPVLGKRWMANCDIPDLDLFPAHYGIKHMQFSAGMENTLLHLGIWMLGWLIRLGLPLPLARYGAPLLKLSHFFDCLGSNDGGMHMIMNGLDHEGRPYSKQWFIVARNGDGPQIPCVPAILLARKLATTNLAGSGATACMGMVTLREYLAELAPFSVTTYEKAATGEVAA